ncbi:Cytochrome [Cardamine amara subsp. amara]|uniref:Cytochrome n=1 Tax=Cardamine amara subsp. amara TaxID=228776 RepID=A0ABD1A1W3_CARAN
MKKESVEIGKESMKLSNNSIWKMSKRMVTRRESGVWLQSHLHCLRKFSWQLEKLGFDELLERILEEHEKENPYEHQGGGDMMDVLLAAFRDENAEYKITRNHIKSFFHGD